MFLVGDPPTLPLCLDCEDKRQQILERQNDMLERHANYLTDLMERQIGLPGLLRDASDHPRRDSPERSSPMRLGAGPSGGVLGQECRRCVTNRALPASGV
jgi:hypothetical protein